MVIVWICWTNILVFGDKLVFCRRSLIKLDEIILSKGKPLLVRVIYSDIYLPFDIASFVIRMLKYNIGLNIFEPLIHEHYFLKRILNFRWFVYCSTYNKYLSFLLWKSNYKYDIENLKKKTILNSNAEKSIILRKFLKIFKLLCLQ